MDWIARPIRPAIDSTLIFGSLLRRFASAGWCSSPPLLQMQDLRNVLDRRTAKAPGARRRHKPCGARSPSARGRLHQRSRRIDQVVDDQASPAASHRRSRASLRPRSSPTRRLSTMASAASIFLAKNRARSTPPASGETTVRFGRLQLAGSSPPAPATRTGGPPEY